MKNSLNILALFTGLILAFSYGLIFDSFTPSSSSSLPTVSGIGIPQSSKANHALSASATVSIAWWTRVEALSSIVAGFAAFLAAYFARQAYKSGRTSAQSAVLANRILKSSSEAQLRCYISIERPRAFYDSKTNVLRVSFKVFNRGSTPARNLRIYASNLVRKKHDSRTKHSWKNKKPASFGIIAPSQSTWYQANLKMTDGAFGKLNDGSLRYSTAAYVTCDDIYGKQQRQTIRLKFMKGSLIQDKEIKLASP